MPTMCSGKPIVFLGHSRRDVMALFDGGPLSSDGGALLLREADSVLGVTRRLAECFTDHRDPERREHELGCLVAQLSRLPRHCATIILQRAFVQLTP